MVHGGLGFRQPVTHWIYHAPLRRTAKGGQRQAGQPSALALLVRGRRIKAFVFIESESRVWAYDGDRLLILNTETSNGTNSTGAIYSSRFPCAVPGEVISRLSEPAKRAIEPH